MAEYRGRKRSSEKDLKAVEDLILDYACRNYMEDVVAAICEHGGYSSFKESLVSHLRLVASTLLSIVLRENIAEFDHALLLLDIINVASPDLVTAKQMVKLTTGIKTKIMLNKLFQTRFDYANVCACLNKYFPKAELKTTGVSKEECTLNSYKLRYRRLLTRLMLVASERESYLRNEMDAELGPAYTGAIQRLLRYYADRLNERLSVPVIEQIISEGPHSQISHGFTDSQSDCMDKLLSISFRGPPTEDQLLALLKECWEQEEEMDVEEKMETTNGDDDDDDWESATDIFDFPTPPNDPGKTSNNPQRLSNPQERMSHPQDTRGSATHTDRCRSGPNDEPVRDGKGSNDAEASQFGDSLVVNCPSETSFNLVGVRFKPLPSKSLDPTDVIKDSVCSATLEDAASTTTSSFSESASDKQQIMASAPEEIEVLLKHFHNLKNPGLNRILRESSALQKTDSESNSVLKSALPRRLEASYLQQTGGRNPEELKSLPNHHPTRETTDIGKICPESSVPQRADLTSSASRQNHFKTKETECPSIPSRSSGEESPQPSCQAVSIGSSGAKTVGKSRIYLSKNGLQSRSQWKQVQYENVDSCVGPTQVESSCLSDVIDLYKASIKRAATPIQIGMEIDESQLTMASSEESQSSSNKSSTSVSLLAGLCGLTTVVQEDEIMGLTLSSPFEDRFISDIEVYPVTRLKHGVDMASIRSTSTRNSELSTIEETAPNSEAVSAPTEGASQPADQENTVSSSSSSSFSNNTLSLDCSGASQSQPEEGRVEEVKGRPEIPEAEERSCRKDGSRHREPMATAEDEAYGSVIQDVVKVRTPKRVCPKKAVVKLKRLSQDSKVRRYLDNSTLGRRSASSAGDTSQSSDSEDSFVPDSDNEDEGSTSTSESSGLPCIELRPDSECQLVRRFPSLREYLRELSTEGSMTKDHKMRECTVRLQRLKPMEIDALTKGKCDINLRRT